ncbi:MAG: hypothetical protein E7462_05355 [Ruminococcaceae bacterium]|nr:hypothetical protein [Oscillospiraceae bacterium]
MEFLAYENGPIWTFEHALTCALIHGILPRPNDIEYPLTLMSRVWKVVNAFPVERAQWMPYWKNSVRVSHEKVRVSYYRYTDLSGKVQLLAFVGNISGTKVDNVTVGFEEPVSRCIDTLEEQALDLSFSLEPFGSRILFLS